MKTEKIISLLRCAIDVADAAFSYDEYIAMCNFLDRLERLGNVLDEEEKELHTQDIQESFINGAEWADQHPHWISVDEELPKDFKIVEDSFYAGKFEETDIVMVAFDDGDFGFARYVHDFPNAEEGEAWYWFAEGNLSGVNLDDGEITHWMPLPQPPKKGGEE